MNTTISKIQMRNLLPIIFSLALLLPLFFNYSSYNEWNPFKLSGPHFLKFYIVLLFIVYLIIFVLQAINHSIKKNEEGQYNLGFRKETLTSNSKFYSFSKLLVLFVAFIGIVRIFQGINNGKPVGFLVLLLVVHTLICVGIKGFFKKLW